MLCLVLGLLPALPRTSADAYHDLQSRLARYASVRVSTYPITGNAWEHEGEHGFLRPNKGFRHEPNAYFATDGRMSWIMQLGESSRPARPYHLAQYAGLTGFESFFNPTVKVTGQLPPRTVEQNRRKLTALDLTIDGQTGVLYLDAASGLPFAWGSRVQRSGEEPWEYMPRIYSEVKLGAPIRSDELRPPQDVRRQ